MLGCHKISSAGCVLVLLFAAGCGDDKPGGKSKPPVPTVEPICIVSAEAIAASPGCLADKDCPCGAFCELGNCVAGCASDSACTAGERCDRFGRCRSATAVSLVPPPSREAAASLQMLQPVVYGGAAGETEVHFIARGTDAGPIRVEASEELEVRCAADGEWGQECRLDGAVENTEVTIWTRQLDGPGRQLEPEFKTGTVQVFQSAEVETVVYATTPFVPDLDGALHPPEPPAVPLPADLQARYAGEAEVVEQTVANDSLFVTAGQLVTNRPLLPIEARLHIDAGGSTGTLVIEDASRSLHPTGEWVGELSGVDLSALTTPTGDAGELLTRVGTAAITFPAHTAIEGPWSASDATRVVVIPEVGAVTVRDDPAGGLTFSFDVVLRYEGVLPTYGGQAGVPQRRLQVTLHRTAELDATVEAPVVPLPVSVPSFSSIVNLPTAWESALSASVDPWAGPVVNNTDPFVRSWFLDRGAGQLEACLQPADNLPEMYAAMKLSITQPISLTTPSVAQIHGQAQSATAFFFDQPILEAFDTVLTNIDNVYVWNTWMPGNLTITPAVMAFRSQSFSGAYTTTVRPGALPCRMASRGAPTSYFVRGAVSVNGAGAVNYDTPINLPTCEALATELGCTPAHAAPFPCANPPCLMPLYNYYFTDEAPVLSFNATAQRTSPATSYAMTFSIEGSLGFDVCLLPTAPVECDEYLSCYVDQATATTAGGLDLNAPLGRVSGDLSCEAPGMNAALAIDSILDLPEGNTARAAGDLYATCLADLERFLAAPPGAANSPEEALGAPASCIDPGRFTTALAHLARHARSRMLTEVDRRAAESARGVRLLQRWLQLHTYLAREAAEAEQLADILRQEGTAVAEPADVLTAGMRAWNLLFHPRFSLLMRAVPPSIFADPDYRDRLLGSTPADEMPHHEQSIGLPVAMLETAAAQLELAERVLSKSLFAGSRARLGDIGALLGRIDLALILAQRMRESAGTPAWAPAYDRALDRATAAYDRVLTAIRAVDDGANPFGIEDDDLPLYFLGTDEGPGGRFAAVSDFLIGTGPGSSAWAPSLVGQAQAALTAARAAWTQQQDRELAVMESTSAHTARVDALRTRYGEVLADLCGRPQGVTTEELLDWEAATGEPFRPDLCYVEVDRADCLVAEDPFLASLTRNDIAFQLQKHSMVNFRPVTSTASLVSTPEEVLTYFRYCTASTVQYPAACVNSAGNNCITCSTTNGPALELPMSIGAVNDLAKRTTPTEFFAWDPQMRYIYETIALSTATALYPTPRTQLQLVEEQQEVDPTCFRGALGQHNLTLRALIKDVEIARSRAEEFVEAYDIAVKACALQAQAEDVQHNIAGQQASIQAMRIQLAMAQTAATSIKTCNAGGWAMAAIPWVGIFTTANCIQKRNAKKSANQIATQVRSKLTTLEAEHNRLVRSLDLAQQACVKEAELELVGARTAALDVERALLELDRAEARLADLEREAQAAYEEGRAAVAEALAEPMLRPGNDAWLGEAIKTYARKFRLARRAVYLAVRAVEYEFQMSLLYRGNVLAAEIPDDLDAVLDNLWAEAAARTIRGRRPAELKAVVSLCEDLLQLADMSPAGEDPAAPEAGYKNLTDVEKLRLILTDPRFAVYDADGSYRGQRIPFSLAPLGRLELGDPSGIAVIADNDCAERLWSVNASILGEEGLYIGSATTFTRVELHKKNTFYSQWCNVPASLGSDFQTASVRPSKNLFHEPGLGADVGAVTIPEGSDYTSARVEAYFNVARSAFESDTYANGETSELAARGLYGEYWLFFPASVLTTYDQDGVPQSNGLDLNKVTDVLLRLDYVSVAKN